MLAEFKIPSSTYYKWRKAYDESGISGLAKIKPGPKRSWNRLTASEENNVLEIARLHPELSSRLLAIKIIDEENFSVSESTVYRILKENNLIAPRPLPEMPAAKEWRHKTKKPDQLWQCDATSLFIVGWGYYKLIPVEDDFSRKIVAWDLKKDETAFSFSDIIEMAVENARKEGHLIDKDSMPDLYTDNGSGFTSKLMAEYLSYHGNQAYLRHPVPPRKAGARLSDSTAGSRRTSAFWSTAPRRSHKRGDKRLQCHTARIPSQCLPQRCICGTRR